MQHDIGPYEVLGIIGDGGMGTVYRGRDPRFDRPVAIKVLHPQFQRDQEVVERFKSEAVIQAKLNHPNIVTVFDFIATKDTLAMVMEYVEGRPLNLVIQQCHGPMDPARAGALTRQILSAMGYAHGQGLVHRDIKPSNIAIQESAGEEIAKVMDFGIAKILGSEKLKTATGARMGTLAYMSPEQIKSPKNVDARSDIYSLGAVLFEMLTGQLPFEADSEYELMRLILEAPPRPAIHFQPATPLQAAALRAMAKSPGERFSSCSEFKLATSTDGALAPWSTPGTPSASLPPRSEAPVPRPELFCPIAPPLKATESPLDSAEVERELSLSALGLLAATLLSVGVVVIGRQRNSVGVFILLIGFFFGARAWIRWWRLPKMPRVVGEGCLGLSTLLGLALLFLLLQGM